MANCTITDKKLLYIAEGKLLKLIALKSLTINSTYI